MKNCPFCSESIQDLASKCRYCGEFLSTNNTDMSSQVNVSSTENENSQGIKTQLSEFLLFQRIKVKCIDCKHEGMSGISDIKQQGLIFGLGFSIGFIICAPFVMLGGLIGGLIGGGLFYFLTKLFNNIFQKRGMVFVCNNCKSKNIVKIK